MTVDMLLQQADLTIYNHYLNTKNKKLAWLETMLTLFWNSSTQMEIVLWRLEIHGVREYGKAIGHFNQANGLNS